MFKLPHHNWKKSLYLMCVFVRFFLSRKYMLMSNVYYINLTYFCRSQYLQLIDVERHSENSMNYFEAEVQHCNNIFHNLFPTENETYHIWDNCLEVGRCFENQDGATLRRGTLLEDAAELDVIEFPNGSTTGSNKQCFMQRII